MNNKITDADVNSNQTIDSQEKWTELVKAVHHNGLVSLKSHFEDVEGQVLNQEIYGPVFVYQVKDDSNNGYACGFFLRELVAKFQSGSDAGQWMASFYFELMKTEGGKLLPKPPASEDEAKAFIDKVLVPCMLPWQRSLIPNSGAPSRNWACWNRSLPTMTEWCMSLSC